VCVCVCVCVCVRVRALVHVRRSCKHKYQALSHLRARICACTCMFVHKSLTFIDQGLPPLLLCKLVLSRSSREDFHLSLHTILPVIFSSMYSGPCACVRVCICACVRVCVCVCVCVCARACACMPLIAYSQVVVMLLPTTTISYNCVGVLVNQLAFLFYLLPAAH